MPVNLEQKRSRDIRW